MRTLLEYVERAKLQANPPNLEGLAKALDVHRSSVYQWRTGDLYPSEDVMILLGIMAGENPGQAIIDLMNIKAVHKSNGKIKRRVSIINEHLGINDEQYRENKTVINAPWNVR